MGSPSPAPPTYQDLRNAVDTDLALIGTELGSDIQTTVTSTVDAYILALGPGVTPKDGVKALQQLYSAMGPAREQAIKNQLGKVDDAAATTAANALDTTSSTTYESTLFSGLTKDQQIIARNKYASKQVGNLMNTASVPGGAPAPTVDQFLMEVDNQVATGAISPGTAAEIRNRLNTEVSNYAKKINSDIEEGIISKTGIRTRIDAIPNPSIRAMVESKFKGELQGMELDSRITSDLGNAATTRASVEAHIASLTPDQAKEYRDKMQGKLQARAQGYRDALAAGGMTVADVSTAIGASPSQFERDVLTNLLQPEISGREIRDIVEGRPDISGVANVRNAVREVIDSPDFQMLPPWIQKAFREAVTHQVERLVGTDGLYQLEEAKLREDSNLRNLEIRRKEWQRRVIQLRRLALPTAILAAAFLGGGGLLGGAVFSVGAGLGVVGAAGMGMTLGYGVSRWIGYTSSSDIEMQKIRQDVAGLRAENQKAYNGIHTIRAERTSMPVQALAEAAQLAAEVSWTTRGKESGLTKEQFIEAFKNQHNLDSINEIRRALSGLHLSPTAIPLTTSS